LQAASKPHVFSTAAHRAALEKGFFSSLLNNLDLAPSGIENPAP